MVIIHHLGVFNLGPSDQEFIPENLYSKLRPPLPKILPRYTRRDWFRKKDTRTKKEYCNINLTGFSPRLWFTMTTSFFCPTTVY